MISLYQYFLFTARETELRYVRKTAINIEQEVCVLEKHIENMNNAVITLTANTQQLKFGYMIYESYLNNLRSKFRNALAHIPLPGKNYFRLIN